MKVGSRTTSPRQQGEIDVFDEDHPLCDEGDLPIAAQLNVLGKKGGKPPFFLFSEMIYLFAPETYRARMSISDVRVIKKTGCKLFLIDDLSSDFKNEIRTQLTGLFHGFAHIEDLPGISYKYTIQDFLERFKGKTQKTKKGMIGELLAHVLLHKYLPGWKTLSIIKNKEESSIKKGFDIIYLETKGLNLWYTEVKSGRNPTKFSSNGYNTALLKRSKVSLSNMFKSKRRILWTSALVDLELVIKSKKKKSDLKTLLFSDSPQVIKRNTKRNAILISVLYHNLSDEVTISNLQSFFANTVSEKRYNDVLVISIQKATFQKVINFLKSEA